MYPAPPVTSRRMLSSLVVVLPVWDIRGGAAVTDRPATGAEFVSAPLAARVDDLLALGGGTEAGERIVVHQ